MEAVDAQGHAKSSYNLSGSHHASSHAMPLLESRNSYSAALQAQSGAELHTAEAELQ